MVTPRPGGDGANGPCTPLRTKVAADGRTVDAKAATQAAAALGNIPVVFDYREAGLYSCWIQLTHSAWNRLVSTLETYNVISWFQILLFCLCVNLCRYRPGPPPPMPPARSRDEEVREWLRSLRLGVLPREEVGLALSRYFAVKTQIDDTRHGPCNQSDTREWQPYEEAAELLSNPLRNGVLLSDLMTVLVVGLYKLNAVDTISWNESTWFQPLRL
jgi:hypothetical protein